MQMYHESENLYNFYVYFLKMDISLTIAPKFVCVLLRYIWREECLKMLI